MDYKGARIRLLKGIRVGSCRKEPETVRWIETYLKADQVLYDVGANIGAYSLIAAKHYRGKVKVFAFEPAFQTFPILVRNIIKNECSAIVFPMNMPIGGHSGLVTFNYISLKEGSSCHALGDAIDYKGDGFDPVLKQFTLATSIDTLVQEHGLPAPNHLKLDVDGIEFEILKGAESTMRDNRFDSLMVEGGERFALEEMVAFLKSCGLQMVERHHHPATDNMVFRRAR